MFIGECTWKVYLEKRRQGRKEGKKRREGGREGEKERRKEGLGRGLIHHAVATEILVDPTQGSGVGIELQSHLSLRYEG